MLIVRVPKQLYTNNLPSIRLTIIDIRKKVKAVLTLLDMCKYDTNLSKGNYQCKYGCSKFIEIIVVYTFANQLSRV